MTNEADQIEVRAMTESDIPALVECIRRCYGDSYSSPMFYDEGRVREMLRAGVLYSRVAVLASGKVVGHLGTILEDPNHRTADGVVGVVDKEFRGQGLLLQLGASTTAVYKDLDLYGVQLYALSLHTIVQRQVRGGGGAETGVLLAHFPQQTQVSGFAETATSYRPAAVFSFLPFRPFPAREIYLPDRYRPLAQGIYFRLGCQREISSEQEALAGATDLFAEESVRGGARILVKHAGSDFSSVLSQEVERWIQRGMDVVYLDVPLDSATANAAIEEARAQKFFYGGLVIERGDTDRLRLQRIETEAIAPDEIQIHSDDARTMLNFILRDAMQ